MATNLNVIGCGRVGQTLVALLHRHRACTVQDLYSSRLQSAEEAANFAGAGRPVASLQEMRPADVWMLSVPDSQVGQVAAALAEMLAARAPASAPATVFHCSGFLPASALSPLQALGWAAASLHPVCSFAAPQRSVAQFQGTPCGLEGDPLATQRLNALVDAIGGLGFVIAADAKPLYHAAAVFASNFTVVLQAIGREAWQEAGVPTALLARVQEALLRGTVDNVLALGPAASITGPAARGDDAVVASQGACVTRWHPEAGAVYAAMSTLARRLAVEGTTLPPPPTAARP